MQLAARVSRSSLAASCSQELAQAQAQVVPITSQVRRSPHGFTAIDVEPDDSVPPSSVQARSVVVFGTTTVLNNNGSNDDHGNEEEDGCRRRRPGGTPNSHHPPPTSQTQKSSSSCLRDCLLCKCCNKGMEESTNDAAADAEENGFENCELEEIVAPPKYRPESIAALCAATRFTESEIKRIYRGFKAECPAGIIREETFKFIYSQFFPQGANTGLYAHYVFNTLDKDHTGILSFENFVQGLSILSRGTLEEKLCWTFSLYDINHDGKITREEMTDIVTAIYELMGEREDGGTDDVQIKNKVDIIFQKMDSNRDGVITIEEFLDCGRKDKIISDSMSVFDSTICPLEKLHTLPAYVVDRNPTADTTESMNGYSQQTDFYKSDASNGPRTEETQKTATVPKSQTSASSAAAAANHQLSKSATRASSNRKQSMILMNGKAKQKSSSSIRHYHHHHQLKHYHIPFETYQQQSTTTTTTNRPTQHYCPSVRNPSYPSGYSEYHTPQMTAGGIATITPLATGQCRPVDLGCHQRPELPTLVKVKAWYTVSKQGLTY